MESGREILDANIDVKIKLVCSEANALAHKLARSISIDFPISYVWDELPPQSWTIFSCSMHLFLLYNVVFHLQTKKNERQEVRHL